MISKCKINQEIDNVLELARSSSSLNLKNVYSAKSILDATSGKPVILIVGVPVDSRVAREEVAEPSIRHRRL